jgi:uncharacterized protein YdhG (YjbR/CyaY superfamily)
MVINMGFASVDEYVNSLDENGKKYVNEFIGFMKDEFPKVTPKISFSMPMWWAGAKMYEGYVAVSAAKNHVTVHFLDESYLDELKKELPGLSFGKKCINVKYGDEHSFSVVMQKAKKYFSSIAG